MSPAIDRHVYVAVTSWEYKLMVETYRSHSALFRYEGFTSQFDLGSAHRGERYETP